jgi:NAD-dependent DNA ligase
MSGPLFLNLSFCLELQGESFKARSALKNAIEGAGGLTTTTLTKKTSYLIANLNALNCDNARVRKATELGVAIVEEAFIADCLELGSLLDSWNYTWIGQTVFVINT